MIYVQVASQRLPRTAAAHGPRGSRTLGQRRVHAGRCAYQLGETRRYSVVLVYRERIYRVEFPGAKRLKGPLN